MGTLQPTAQASPPQDHTHELQPTLPLGTQPILNKVSAFALHTIHYVIANVSQVVVDDAAAENMPDTLDPSQHDSPFLRLPIELRLEIFRLAFQEYLDTVTSPARPYYRCSPTERARAALALLEICRTLRVECIDAVEPLVSASKSTLQSEINILAAELRVVMDAKLKGRGGGWSVYYSVYYKHFSDCKRLRHGMVEIDELCGLLAAARTADKEIRAG